METWIRLRIVLDSSLGHVTSHNAAAKPCATLGHWRTPLLRSEGLHAGVRVTVRRWQFREERRGNVDN